MSTPKKSLFFLAYLKKIPWSFLRNPKKSLWFFFSPSKKTPGLFHSPKNHFGPKFQTPKSHSDPPVINENMWVGSLGLFLSNSNNFQKSGGGGWSPSPATALPLRGACQMVPNYTEHTNTHLKRYILVELFNPLSQEGGVVATPPLSDFPSCRFCVFAKIAIRSVYPPFVQIPMYLWKKFQKFLPWKKLGGGGAATTPPPPNWEGRGGKIPPEREG